ncbi:MAG: hypothetical protein M1838_001587 [Thelocarpon superellum]|nr:MAG: hypothetical protein M1838_001587 [Thelocarpon superellum]
MADGTYVPIPTGPPPPYDSSAPPVDPSRSATSGSKGGPALGPGATGERERGKLPPVAGRPPLPFEHPTLVKLRGKRVVLASASPRRKQLLAQMGLHSVEIIPSTVPEAFPKSLAPFEYVLQTATQKAMTVYRQEIDNEERGEPGLVLAADTVVVSQLGEILEKPRSEAEHLAMLKTLRNGGTHSVFTAVAAMVPLETAATPGYVLETCEEQTVVRFDKNDKEILAYVQTREGADKAGGYGIQGLGAILIDKIDGSYDNVVGLPLRATFRLIEKVLDLQEERNRDELDSDGDEDLLS